MEIERGQQAVRPPEAGEIEGLPKALAAGTVAALFEAGKALAVATRETLTIHELILRPEGSAAREVGRHALPGPAVALAETTLGLLVATERRRRSVLALLKGRELAPVMEVRGKIHALAAAGAQAYAVIAERPGGCGRLVRINLRQREIVAERPLDHAGMRLAVGPAGQHVVVTDVVERVVMSLGSDLRPMEVRVAPGGPVAAERPHDHEHPSHGQGCCCCICVPVTPGGEDEPGRPRTPPREDEPGPPGETRPDRPPGDVAVPSDDGGTIVGNGDRVDHYPPAGTSRGPCGRKLFYTVDDLRRIGPYVVASDRTGRHVSLLSADMNLLDEWEFGRGGARLLTAEGTATMVMHHRSSGLWTWRDVHGMVAERRPDLELFPRPTLESKTFIGQKLYPLSHGGYEAPKSIRALLLPVIENDQSYTSPNLAGLGAYVNRSLVKLVKEYHDENSFGMLTDISIAVFGASVGPAGTPLKLPRKKLTDYFYPEYDPARVELVKNGVNAAARIVFDGRESLTIEAKPMTGGFPGGTLDFPFFALALEREDRFYPVSIKFLGSETLSLAITMPDGSAKTLNLTFPAKEIKIEGLGNDAANQAELTAKLNELTTYLDGVMKAAEAAAGISPRLFATPKAYRIGQTGQQFGRLLVTFAAANTTGNRLSINTAAGTHPGGDPLGLGDPILGTLTAGDTMGLARLLENSALLAQEAKQFGYNSRLLNAPSCSFDAAASRLTTSIVIENRHGGPGAEVKRTASFGLEALFDTATAKPNSATTKNNAQALRDREDLYRDAFSAAIERLRQAPTPPGGKAPLQEFLEAMPGFGCVLIMPVEPPTPNPADVDAVLPSEVWKVTPLHRPFYLRGAENVTTVIDRKDDKIQLQSAWALVFMAAGKPDLAVICHEMGHALKFDDLYHLTGFRDELAYLDDWAMMDNDDPLPHHCGYHKLQAGWVPEGAGTEVDYGRVFPLGLPDASTTRTWELLLVPVEIWRDSLVASSRAAFGVGAGVPVAQLARIDFGGDGATFGLIEARQPGARYSQHLPGNGGVIITNAISWTLDERFATNTWYRRPLQLLNPDNILRNPGDSFDLARAPELPVKGMRVELLDRKSVEDGVQVYRVRVTRENAEFIDLYFTNAEIYYKNPDLWVDWTGNNTPNPENFNPDFPPGQPTDQGEAIRTHPSEAVRHLIVARIRNRGQVKALDVKFNFYYFEPPGAGDGKKPMNVQDLSRYKLVGTKTLPEVPPNNDPRKVFVNWDVPAGFSGHTCLLAQIEDYRVPEDSTGAALGSNDMWQVNNHAQKNVDKFEALKVNPYLPVEFDFSVYNGGVAPELAYPEPAGLPYGMKLTVTPPRRLIMAGETALFHCKLELDERTIRTGCENDQRFQIHAWREDPESSDRWGGVEYEIRPRERTETKLGGDWWQDQVTIKGTVAPGPGGGTARLRLDFQGQQPRWVAVAVGADGTFAWNGNPPAGSFVVEAVAWFEGNRKFGPSRSNALTLKPPPILH